MKETIKAPGSTSRTNMPVPNVQPLAYMPDMPAPITNDMPPPPMSIRDRIKQDPALASTLLGGLGNAGLL
jgi:hypothetical protein